jgi:hypothetical protein
MDRTRSSAGAHDAALTAADSDARELVALRASSWRKAHTIHALQDTIVGLRASANSLAIDNALLLIENERLRVAEHAASSSRG